MKQTMKFLVKVMLVMVMSISLMGCGTKKEDTTNVYIVGICNYADDASLNQIVDSIKTQLTAISKQRNVTIQIAYDNCNGDAAVMEQIISNFTADGVDLMIGVATPVAVRMQALTEDSKIPVVFAAVSDPVASGLVASLKEPGGNITGTSDYLNTTAIFQLMQTINPTLTKVGLLYDLGQDSSTTAIAQAKEYLNQKGLTTVVKTGTNSDEIVLAAQSLVSSGVQAVFTPSDNTVMMAELAIYEILAQAKIPHYGGADSFALNGAFIGYGVDYTVLGTETANMAALIILDSADPAKLAVKTFDNGIATVNTEICAELGFDFEDLKAKISPLVTQIKTIVTAEAFN